MDNVEVELDERPLIPGYLEIEGHTKNDVLRVAGLLGYGEHQLTGENT